MRSRQLTFSLVTEERVVIMNGCANRFDTQRRLGFERAAHVKVVGRDAPEDML